MKKKKNETAEFFEKNRYVYVKDVMTSDECREFVETFNQYLGERKTNHDDMCPTSDSMYGGFDKWCELKRPLFEKALNLKLLSTYSFARVYRPGEVLQFHTDRPSCEITVTITIAFDTDGKVWPIWILNKDESSKHRESYSLARSEAEDCNKDFYKKGQTFDGEMSFDIPVGDAVAFRGMEIFHWRNKYTEGKYQVQVFLHYVDANGPYTEWINDKREKLNM